jgi:hypothetical protein
VHQREDGCQPSQPHLHQARTHVSVGRHGKTLESKNAFIYRFTGDRIAEMWMFVGADPGRAAAFFA